MVNINKDKKCKGINNDHKRCNRNPIFLGYCTNHIPKFNKSVVNKLLAK